LPVAVYRDRGVGCAAHVLNGDEVEGEYKYCDADKGTFFVIITLHISHLFH
jgi:hypothetical protein